MSKALDPLDSPEIINAYLVDVMQDPPRICTLTGPAER